MWIETENKTAFSVSSRGPHKHADCVLPGVLLARWCPCLQWSWCRGSTWERLWWCSQLLPPEQKERWCRREKATLHLAAMNNIQVDYCSFPSFPSSRIPSYCNSSATNVAVSRNIYMIEKKWRFCIEELYAIHKGKFLYIYGILFYLPSTLLDS